mmetsp:Transcript_55352/g.123725  ORF Transcript_55352/g.123725 Transcript_55352/m.123725 type:complete len:103 (+) Transcript_55352:174-482(+)
MICLSEKTVRSRQSSMTDRDPKDDPFSSSSTRLLVAAAGERLGGMKRTWLPGCLLCQAAHRSANAERRPHCVRYLHVLGIVRSKEATLPLNRGHPMTERGRS